MRLEGSCYCRAVRFTVDSETPYPYMLCYCSICRKTAGGGGYAINIMGTAASLEVVGGDAVRQFRATLDDGSESDGQRHFCGRCGSALWVFDPSWPDLVHPFASAIDTPLPVPPARVHILLESRAPWVAAPEAAEDSHFTGYPDLSIADWHEAHDLGGG